MTIFAYFQIFCGLFAEGLEQCALHSFEPDNLTTYKSSLGPRSFVVLKRTWNKLRNNRPALHRMLAILPAHPCAGCFVQFSSIFTFIRKLAAVPIFPSSPGKDTWTDSVPDVCNNCSFAVTWYVTVRYVWYVFRPKRRILERMVMQHVKTPTKFADWHNDQNTFKCHMLAYAQKVSLLNIKFVKKYCS